MDSARSDCERPAAPRRLATVAYLLLLVPLVIEGIALHPARFAGYTEPLFSAGRLLLTQLIPYWIAALSVAVWAVLLRRFGSREEACSARPSAWIAVLALAVTVFAAFRGTALEHAMLHGGVSLRADRIQLGRGGPLAANYPLECIPLEEAGSLAEAIVEPTPSGEAVVRWVGARRAGAGPTTKRAELVAGGAAHDVTGDYLALEPGTFRLFARRVAVGPDAIPVRLRLADDPAPPVVFLDHGRADQSRGVALDTGGGDVAYRLPAGASGPSRIGPPRLRVEGRHAPSGFSVLVLSGEEWRQHDLRRLLRTGGRLELQLACEQPPPWNVRLVGDSAKTQVTPLRAFERSRTPDGRDGLSLDLAKIDWRDVPPSHVVGVALEYAGEPGPFQLEVVGARVAPPAARPSGFGLGATSALDPGLPPRDGLLAVGEPDARDWLTGHLGFLRLAAALLVAIAALGPALFLRLILSRPFAFLLAVLAGPGVAAALDWGLPFVFSPRIEHAPLVLGLAAASTATLVRRRGPVLALPGREPEAEGRSEPALEPEPAQGRLAWLDALKGVAILGVIGIHVTADPAGLPFQSATAGERLVPMMARAAFTGLNYPVFLLTSFYALALTLRHRPRRYGEVMRARFSRLAVPLVIWTIFFLAIRHGKALAFGYHDAYRRELADGSSWLAYLLLGSGQYHLHFLPLLLGLTLFYPLYRPAARRPWLGLLLLGTLLVWPWLDEVVYGQVASPEIRQYVLRATKTFAYLGYGLFAFALFGLRDRGLSTRGRRTLLALAWVTAAGSLALLLRHGVETAHAGRWLPLPLATHMARYLLPAAVFVLFMLAERMRFPRWMVRGGVLCMGLYLLHPAVLDLLEILERDVPLAPAAIVAVNAVAVVLVTGLAVVILRRSRAMAWLLGVPGGRS